MRHSAQPEIVTSKGPAAGRLVGVNHLQFIVNDINESVRFYRDILGLCVIRTKSDYPAPGRGYRILHNVFFDLGNSEYLSLIQIDESSAGQQAEPSVSSDWLWPDNSARHVKPAKMDHLAFNVPTHDDMTWFHEHLMQSGVKVSPIVFRPEESWVESMYFYDPNGIPLEIATLDLDSPRWDGFDAGVWFWDREMAALRDFEG